MISKRVECHELGCIQGMYSNKSNLMSCIISHPSTHYPQPGLNTISSKKFILFYITLLRLLRNNKNYMTCLQDIYIPKNLQHIGHHFKKSPV